jgi:excisionase family DNA binding protein
VTETREIVVRIVLEYPSGSGPVTAAVAAANEPLAYKVEKAADLLDVGETTVWELIARGEIESIKVGASRRITRAGLEAYVRRLAAEGRGDAA